MEYRLGFLEWHGSEMTRTGKQQTICHIWRYSISHRSIPLVSFIQPLVFLSCCHCDLLSRFYSRTQELQPVSSHYIAVQTNKHVTIERWFWIQIALHRLVRYCSWVGKPLELGFIREFVDRNRRECFASYICYFPAALQELQLTYHNVLFSKIHIKSLKVSQMFQVRRL